MRMGEGEKERERRVDVRKGERGTNSETLNLRASLIEVFELDS